MVLVAVVETVLVVTVDVVVKMVTVAPLVSIVMTR